MVDYSPLTAAFVWASGRVVRHSEIGSSGHHRRHMRERTFACHFETRHSPTDSSNEAKINTF